MPNPVAIPGTNVPAASLIAPGGAQGVQGLAGPQGPGAGSGGLPSGCVMDYAGASIPSGWLLCDGSAVSRTTYSDLYAALGGSGSPWGAGDGVTTFNLPDLRGRTTIGSGQGTYTGASARALGGTGGEELHKLVTGELSSHSHTMANHTHPGVNHLHSCSGVDHLHNMDHYHNFAGNTGWHGHGLGGHTHTYTVYYNPGGTWNPPGGNQWTLANANTAGPSGGSDGAYVGGNTVYASQTSGGWVNTGAADRSLAFTSAGADRDLTTGVPNNNTSDATGSGTGHNTMQPFGVVQKIIKT